ncbi:MAG: type IX secretion system sortase PorU [Muribaculaceae bacterium]|nr:type IX secretion system sortase PorU [Muribaculaceae bacterium]
MFRLYYTLLLFCISTIASTLPAYGFDTDLYAESSRLSSGRWVKIAVPSSGVYHIPTSQLRAWGFSDIDKVHIYGYGGATLPLLLSKANYIDDLPPVQQLTEPSGITFYAVGPEEYTRITGDRYVQTTSIYDTRGYYFLSDNPLESAPDIPEKGVTGSPDAHAAPSFNEVTFHEQNLTTASNNGWLMVGEDFRFTPSRTFNFTLTDRVEDTPVWMQSSFVLKAATPSYGTLSFSANGQTLPGIASDRISGISDVNEIDGREGISRRTFDMQGERLTIGINLSSSGSILRANLNYITINYTRRLRLSGNAPLKFTLDSNSAILEGATQSTTIWDVTDPSGIYSIPADLDGGKASWSNTSAGQRRYVAWSNSIALPQPVFVENVSAQNLHSITQVPHLLIITPTQWKSQAERLAEFHRNSATEPLEVEVVTDKQIYNEFASGSADVSAIRKFCKMLYDRGRIEGVLSGQEEHGSKLQYVLLMAAPTYDNRHIEANTSSIQTLPAYYPGAAASQLAAETAFGTDDLIAMLEDNSGTDLNGDRLSVAVGRIPARISSEATAAVDKILRYANDTKRTTWKNRVLMIADDGNSAIHAKDTDRMAKALLDTDRQPYFIEKIYIDAYEFTGGEYPGARADMYRLLDEGVVWWTYVGHANTTSWTSENLLNLNDINTFYVKHPPMLYSATCLFLKWDADITCGGEILFNETNGGIIGAISATRPVYITPNGNFTEALGGTIGKRDADGRMLTIGEIYRRAKNVVANDPGMLSNHRRFVLMGDPALRLAVPDFTAVLEAIDGIPTENDTRQIVVAARQNATFTGKITDAEGNTITDFNGVILAELYDAEQSYITNGNNDKYPQQYPFDKQGGRLFSGAARVENGIFSMKVSMPSDIADNFRPAAFSMYAYSDDSGNVREAAGVDRSVFVYGYDDSAPEDSEAPRIASCVLHHSGFKDGDAVNPSPVLLAAVSDNIALNLSSAGIGHNMTLTLDGTKMYNDVAQYFTPASDGSPSGTIAYPLEDLTPGQHTLRLRVWDTSGNPAAHTISFSVEEGLAPAIFEVFSDANPARTTANFYVRHDRPEGRMEITVHVYDMMGRELWSRSVTASSDMDLSAPLTWDLCDYAGRRVQRGIYLYRAEVRTPDSGYSSSAKRIAVTAP